LFVCSQANGRRCASRAVRTRPLGDRRGAPGMLRRRCMGRHRLGVVREAVQAAPAVWLCPARASVPRGGVTTGVARAVGSHTRTTAGRGRRCDRRRSGWVAAMRPPSATRAAVAGGSVGRVALARCRRRRVWPWWRRVGWLRRAGEGAGDRPPGAGATAATATGRWPLAGDGVAGCAADAVADAARSVSPPCVAGRPRPRHGGGKGRTRAPHLRKRARRWRRARRLVARRAAAARRRAPRRRLWRRCHAHPLRLCPSIPPPLPYSSSGVASAAVPPLLPAALLPP